MNPLWPLSRVQEGIHIDVLCCEGQQLISELNEILAHDKVDKMGAWKKKLRSQSHELFERLPKAIQEPLLLQRDPYVNGDTLFRW